ncbi:MAG: hypothetical protein E7596_04695 [Ruminococcaceae bacterium]|nr:hypothetical protein [Oscillospiraceae bacterium]
MTELERIEYAKSFIDKLANGINPLDDSPIPEKDIANNVRLSRCFFYVSDILRQVVENGGITKGRAVKPKRESFSLSQEEREKIKVSDYPLTITEITKHLNSLIDEEKTKKIASNAISDWLVETGFLCVITYANNKHRKSPTEQGSKIGIITEEKMGPYGKYTAVLYSPSAQQFIYDNLEAIVSSKEK